MRGKSTFLRDLDVRGFLAIVALLGLLGVIFVQLIQGSGTPSSIRVPAELAGSVGAIIGFYFGGRSGNGK